MPRGPPVWSGADNGAVGLGLFRQTFHGDMIQKGRYVSASVRRDGMVSVDIFGVQDIEMGDPTYAVLLKFSPSGIIHFQVVDSSSMPRIFDQHCNVSTQHPRPARAFRIRFEIHQHSFSALKVDQLKITGEGYKPYKGVRGRSIGDVDWRW